MTRDHEPVERQELEGKLRAYYELLGRQVASSENVWEAVLARLNESERLRPRVSLPVRLARGMAAAGVTFMLMASAFHFVPKMEMTAMAVLRPDEADRAARLSLFSSDPGLFALFRKQAFQEIGVSDSKQGLILEVMDFYADQHRTVLTYRVRETEPENANSVGSGGENHTAPVLRRWNILFSNSELMAWNQLLDHAFAEHRSLRGYSVYMQDQFGVRYRMQASAVFADGTGYLEFAPVHAVGMVTGLRMSLHVPAMGAVFAPDGPFGEKRVEIREGNWEVSFLAFPTKEQEVQLYPRAVDNKDGWTITLESVRHARSQTILHLRTDGMKDETNGDNIFFEYRLYDPSGREIIPVGSSNNGRQTRIAFPPLYQAGTYILKAYKADILKEIPARKEKVTRSLPAWELSWSQPQIMEGERGAPYDSLVGMSVLYEGTDWHEAVSFLPFPAVTPPPGYTIGKLRVASDFRLPVPAQREEASRNLTFQLITPTGKRVNISQSNVWDTPVPTELSLEQYLAVNQKSPDAPIRHFDSYSIDGILAHEWHMRDDAGRSSIALYLYPVWGSISITGMPGTSREELLAVAKELVQAMGNP